MQTTAKHDTSLKVDLCLRAIDAKIDKTSILVICANSDDIIPLNAQMEKLIDTRPTLERLIVEHALDKYCIKHPCA